jgi:chemotaxis signal transduction protein
MNTWDDDTAGDLACLLVPTRAGDLLLPAPAVAEIVRGGQCALGDGALPPWAQWVLRWRGIEVPVLDLAALSGAADDDAGDGAVHVVVNRTRAHDAAPFVALAALAAPRLVHLAAEDLGEAVASDRPGIAAHVGVGEIGADIPDLGRLQDLLAGAP